MCGIGGVISLDGVMRRQGAVLRAMSSQLRLRGPDDCGFYLSRSGPNASGFVSSDLMYNDSGREGCSDPFDSCLAGFAHRRLSIIDLTEGGRQPMSSYDGRYWIVFNGEIFNYKELRSDLIKSGIQFRSNTDTEVLVNCFAIYGEAMLERLNGMFAFAIWDEVTKSLFAARDRIGIKPFFYTKVGQQLLFASDVKTLIASGLYAPRPDLASLYHATSFGVALAPSTCFEDVSVLEPGCSLKIDKGRVSVERYWNIPLGTQRNRMSEQEAVELIDLRLKEAVAKQLEADVPVGVFLSGGVDSSLVAGVASSLTSELQAFTLAFTEEKGLFNEAEAAASAAASWGLDHIVKYISHEDLIGAFDEIVRCHEEPYYGLSPTYLVAQLAASHGVKAVLNGLGGDELFGGYRRYRIASLWSWLKHFEPLVRNRFASRFLDGRTREILCSRNEYEMYVACFSPVTEDFKRLVFNVTGEGVESTGTALRNRYGRDGGAQDAVELFNYLDLRQYIGNHHTYRTDQFTMNFSIEGRFPLLDHEFVEAAFQIPSNLKVNRGRGKYILKQVAANTVPSEILRARKQGFRLPLGAYMRDSLRETVATSIERLKERQIMNPDGVQRVFTEFQEGRRPHYQVWQLVMIEQWLTKVCHL